MSFAALELHNGRAVALADLPTLPGIAFAGRIIDLAERGLRLVAYCGLPDGSGGLRRLAVLADDTEGRLLALAAPAEADSPALTPDCPAAHLFERELFEQWGLHPEGHPWLKPVRGERRRPDGAANPRPDEGRFFRINGSQVHEVAVGPVHAGVIEPGHFRFQCQGETVHHLEIALGYQHRGIEARLAGGPDVRTGQYMQTLAGDTSIGHSLAYAQVCEALAGHGAPSSAQVIRGIALELERLANHTGDLGALAGDVGFLPTQSFCGRLRGDYLNLTALICGNRFGRNLVRPGGVAWGLDAERAGRLRERLDRTYAQTAQAVELLWDTPSVMARFEGCGQITRADAERLGLVGVAARACGLERDARYSHPLGIYALAHLPVATATSGDVLARAFVRWLEIQRSVEFIRSLLDLQCGEEIYAPPPPLAGGRLAVSLVEGWRGEICHVAATDPAGRFLTYKVVDPSFHNWPGLALALRGVAISDFPINNKSFSLSYCGHDL